MEKVYPMKKRVHRLSKRNKIFLVGQRVIYDFIKNTSFHGIKYFDERITNGGSVVKLFWAISVFLAFVGSGLLLREFWERYQVNASMTIVESFYVPSFAELFPAITVCSMTGPELAKREEILETLVLPTNISKEEASYLLKNIAQMARIDAYLFHERDMMNEILNINGMDMLELFKDLRGTCRDTVESCWWNEKELSCEKFFEPVFCSRGLCCSFNYKLENLLHPDQKRHPATENIIPTAGYGLYSGLTLVFKEKQFIVNHDNGTIARIASNTVGSAVFIHHPLEYPSLFRLYLQAGREMQLGIIARATVSEPGIARKGELPCKRNEDTKLEYFRFYGVSNCHNSCRMKAALSVCGCVPWQFTPFAKANQYPICQMSMFRCLRENVKKIWSVTSKNTCVCPPRCRNELFIIKSAEIPLAATTSFAPSFVYRNVTDKSAVLRVFMAQDTLERFGNIRITDEIYMLSSVGGIFNLFLGCSILSLFEIAYSLVVFIYSCYNISQAHT